MSKQTESSLFMDSPLSRPVAFYQRLVSGVTCEAAGAWILQRIKAAHDFRQVDTVRELAIILTNLPIREYQLIGEYYLVWCQCRESKYQNEVLEKIIEQSRTYKTQALISRGGFEWYKGNNEAALNFYSEALKTSPTVSQFVDLSKMIAVLKGTEGFHKSALIDLDNLLPIINHAEPLVYYDFLNSYAVELSKSNRLAEAEKASSLAVSSRFAPHYGEWLDTFTEIRSRRCARSAVAVSRQCLDGNCGPDEQAPENAIDTARVQTVIEFMNANFHQPTTLAALARLVHCSPSHLSSLFKAQTGSPPIEYLIRLRMEKARELLATRFEPIKQIMGMVGYTDKTNFTRHFKKYFQVTPSEFRKRKFRR